MQQQHIKVVGAQPCEGLVDGPQDPGFRKVVLDSDPTLIKPHATFTLDREMFAEPGSRAQDPAEHRFGLAAAVDVSVIEHGDADREGGSIAASACVTSRWVTGPDASPPSDMHP